MIDRRVNDHILPSGTAECRYLSVSSQRWVFSAADVHQGTRMRLALAASGTLVDDNLSNSGRVVRCRCSHRTPACPIAALPIRPGLRRIPAKSTLLRGYPVAFSKALSAAPSTISRHMKSPVMVQHGDAGFYRL